MAILLQRVQGERHGRYFFPTLPGVGFSTNPLRWNRRIRHVDDILQLVFGMGTRALERETYDYVRMVALSHPTLRPEVTATEIRWYSQRYVDAINLDTNTFATVPTNQVLSEDFPGIELLASVDMGDYFEPAHAMAGAAESGALVLTFDGLLRNPDLVAIMKITLKRLEAVYRRPVDIEFTIEVIPEWPRPRFILHLLQCRPQSVDASTTEQLPAGIPDDLKIFSANRLVPQGLVQGVRYVVYVVPERYYALTDSMKTELARLIGRINKALEGDRFILMGPGRWGTSNIELGVKVTYAEIYNTSVLAEIALAKGNQPLEVSYGTHFFQDLVEGHIFPLPLYPNDPRTIFRTEFFTGSTNMLTKLLPAEEKFQDVVRVIDVPAVSGGRLLEIVMNGDEDEAFGYLRTY